MGDSAGGLRRGAGALHRGAVAGCGPRGLRRITPLHTRISVAVLGLRQRVSDPVSARSGRYRPSSPPRGFSPGPVDGRFGPLTRAAVAAVPAGGRARRRRDRRPPDPPRARRRRPAAGRGLDAAHRLKRGQAAAASPAALRVLARPRPTAVTAPAPLAAVKRFQHARHLAASGIASAATLRALANHTRRPRLHPAPQAQGPAAPGPGQAPAGDPPTPTRHPHRSSRPSTSPRASRGRSCCCSARWRSLRWRCSRSAAASPTGACRPSRPQPRRPTSRPPATAGARQNPSPAPVALGRCGGGSGPDQLGGADRRAGGRGRDAVSRITPKPGGSEDSTTHQLKLTVDKPEPPEERVERVKALQRQLTWLGFDPGVVDGRYGPLTTEAVRAFQQVRGLPARRRR